MPREDAIDSRCDPRSDAALVLAIRRDPNPAHGDQTEAEAELCRRFGPRVRLYGLRHLRDEDRARELVQAVLLSVLEAARGGRIEEPERLDRFVLGTCRNMVSREHDRARRTIPTEDAHLDVMSHVPDMDWLGVRAVFHCLAKLEPRARQLLFLTFHAELSADQIAAEMGMTPGSVRVARHRALAQVRECIEHRGERARAEET